MEIIINHKPYKIVSETLPLSKRVQMGLEAVEESRLHKKPLWGEGLSVINEETAALPLVIRRAMAIHKVLSEMPVDIKPYELLVGSMVQNTITGRAPFPEFATKDELESAKQKHTGPSFIFGHIELSYPKILREGFSGICSAAEEKLAEIRDEDPDTATWLRAVLISLKGLEIFILRYRSLALKLTYGEGDGKRKLELKEIADICQNIVERPPETFREALQVYWIANCAVESVGHLSSYARFDQNLWPFLKNDLDAGIITMEEAQELVDLQWIKHNERMQLLEAIDDPIRMDIGKTIEESIRCDLEEGFPRGHRFGTRTYQGRSVMTGANYNEIFQNVTLSGLTPDGKDGTNPLTYLALNATLRLKLVKPEMYVRLYRDSPPELYERAANLIRAGLANPNIFNDEAVISGLVDAGYPVEDAREYCGDGCWEAHPQGRSYFKFGNISLTECLLRAICPSSWEVEANTSYARDLDPFADLEIPDPYAFTSYEEVLERFKELVEIYIREWVRYESQMRDGRIYEIAPLPLFSALVEGPIENGRDITQNGEMYQQQGIVAKGLSHTADSLAVIKKLVFEEKSIEWKELLDAVEENWEGKEPLRQFVRSRAPAYGNDLDYVDEIAAEITEHFISCVDRYKDDAGIEIKWTPGLATFGNNAQDGYLHGATPDGRLAREPLSTNASPSVGRAIGGLTAAMNSYIKLPNDRLPIAAPLDLGVPNRPNLLGQIETLMRAFVEGKGSLVTFSVNDAEELKAAQKEPAKYRHLKIRVGGWEAYFVDLPKVQQDFQIQKCEQYA